MYIVKLISFFVKLVFYLKTLSIQSEESHTSLVVVAVVGILSGNFINLIKGMRKLGKESRYFTVATFSFRFLSQLKD